VGWQAYKYESVSSKQAVSQKHYNDANAAQKKTDMRLSVCLETAEPCVAGSRVTPSTVTPTSSMRSCRCCN